MTKWITESALYIKGLLIIYLLQLCVIDKTLIKCHYVREDKFITDTPQIRIFDVYSAITLDQEVAQNGESRLENRYSGVSL